MYIQTMSTPCGQLAVTANNTGLTRVVFDDTVKPTQANALTQQAISQLEQYFSGSRTCFSLPLAAVGTVFQTRVWQALNDIEFGQTASYADIARRIDNPKAVRAVGMANGRNPLAIVVPCHRIIGSNGTLTGYAGGLARKQYLLNMEGAGKHAAT